MRKTVGGFGKKKCISTGVRKPGNTCVTDCHDMTLAIKVTLNPKLSPVQLINLYSSLADHLFMVVRIQFSKAKILADFRIINFMILNPLPDNKMLGFPKLKAFAEGKSNVLKTLKLRFLG